MNDEFDIVAVLWQDHISMDGHAIPENPDDLVDRPTLSVGVLIKQTPKTLLLLSDLERYDDRDEARYTVIIRNAIVGMQKYGTIPIENLRIK